MNCMFKKFLWNIKEGSWRGIIQNQDIWQDPKRETQEISVKLQTQQYGHVLQ